MNKFSIVIFLVACLLSAGLLTAISPQASAVETIDLPTWDTGIEWNMGFYEEIDEDTLTSEGLDDLSADLGLFAALLQEGDFNFDAAIGFYQNLIVLDTNDTSTGIDCYKVKIEQYYGAVMNIDVNLHMDESDVPSGTSEEVPEFNMDLVVDGYLWLTMDVTGYLYFTVDKLALAREEINIQADADIKLDLDMDLDLGQLQYYSIDENPTAPEDDYYYEEEPDIPTSMKMNVALTASDVEIDYDADYDPPVDIFDFPIEPFESWSASSDMTVTLNKITGDIAYDISGTVPGEYVPSEKGTATLGSDITLPDTYGPVSVFYEFDNTGSGKIGDFDDCITIEGYEGYDYDYYYDNPTGGVDTISSDTKSDEDDDFLPDFESFGAEELQDMDLIRSFIISKNYYSPSAGMIVSSDISESLGSDMEGGPFGMVGSLGSVSDMTMEPATIAQVENFRSTQREEMEKQYEDYKAGDDDEGSSTVLILIIVAVIIVVLLVVIMLVMMNKKKGQGIPPGSYPPPSGGGKFGDDRDTPPPPPPPNPDRGNFPPPPPPPSGN